MSNDLAQWRAGRLRSETLPSGLQVTIKRVEMLDLVADGAIPLPLLGMAEQFASGETLTVGLADWPLYAPLINAIAKAVLVDPPAADAPDEAHLGVTELPMSDRIALFMMALGDTQRVATFRGEQDANVATASARQDLREPAE